LPKSISIKLFSFSKESSIVKSDNSDSSDEGIIDEASDRESVSNARQTLSSFYSETSGISDIFSEKLESLRGSSSSISSPLSKAAFLFASLSNFF